MHITYSLRRNQKGVVLATSLMILLVMTVVGVTAMQNTSLEERMAGNTRDRNLAFQSAESAIRNAETFIGNIASISVFDGTGGLYGSSDDTADPFDASTWTGAVIGYSDTALNEVNTQPKYFIRQVGTIPGTQGALNLGPGYGQFRGQGSVSTFEVTARGTGGNDTTQVLVKSHFGRTGL